MVSRREWPRDVLSGADTGLGWSNAVVQASVLCTFVVSAGSITLTLAALPVLLLVCYFDGRFAPLVPLLALVYVVASGMSFDPVPPTAGVVAGLTLSPWAATGTMLWATIVATSIFTLMSLRKPLWIAAVVAVIAAALIAGAYAWHVRVPPAAPPDIEANIQEDSTASASKNLRKRNNPPDVSLRMFL